MVVLRGNIDRWLRLSQTAYLVLWGGVLALFAIAFAISFLPQFHDPIMTWFSFAGVALFVLAYVLRFRGLGYSLLYLLPPMGLFLLGGWGVLASITVSITGSGEGLDSYFFRFLQACFFLSCCWFFLIAVLGLFPDRLVGSGKLFAWIKPKSHEASK